MIVKVQLSLSTTAARRQALVYDRSRRHCWQGDAPRGLARLVRGEPKTFWRARLVGAEIVLDERVGNRDW